MIKQLSQSSGNTIFQEPSIAEMIQNMNFLLLFRTICDSQKDYK